MIEVSNAVDPTDIDVDSLMKSANVSFKICLGLSEKKT